MAAPRPRGARTELAPGSRRVARREGSRVRSAVRPEDVHAREMPRADRHVATGALRRFVQRTQMLLARAASSPVREGAARDVVGTACAQREGAYRVSALREMARQPEERALGAAAILLPAIDQETDAQRKLPPGLTTRYVQRPRMRIGFDVSPLGPAWHPPGVVRATRGLVDALERRGKLEIVRLHSGHASASRGASIAWRQWRLPREIARLGLRGLHSPVSAFPCFASFPRVPTVHELPWLHGVDENADRAHASAVSGAARRR